MNLGRCKNTASEPIYFSRDKLRETANRQFLDFKILLELKYDAHNFSFVLLAMSRVKTMVTIYL
ncbi:hypothetical protein F511_23481 [Dorcoceras hygrometricum]|uniref:Uncharacterized protein n=1 Tax=Dorcoceras hygrometricum TaxID=472368 RepID=A0A2Z7B7N7_9LAMI|nr:hypothetical protein F511_23481 [Dorcoceras hygrometricum]